MTGTGNSYMVSKWFLESVAKVKSELQQVRENHSGIGIGNSDLLVFSYPTHGFTAPWLMLKQIFRLPAGNGVHAVVLPTRAGTRMLGVLLPGMEGTAGYLIALLLWVRGYRVKGVSAIDMPSNWTAVHWGLSDENARLIASKGEVKVKKIAHEILSGHSVYNGFVPLLIGILLSRISLMYLIIAQLILSKLFFASDQCNGCSLCQRICPKQSIKMVSNKPYWTYSCDSCMACMNYCPQKAIQVSPFVIFLFAYVLSLPIATWITATVGYSLVAGPGIIQWAAQYAYTLISVALIYWLLHYVLRYKPIAAMLAWLSHTKYFRRYHAQGVSLNDIHK
jgi:NAD-dependent dihydropyrimidine dehydrogenase PreA subunit